MQAESRWDDLRLGILVLASLAILVVASLYLAGARLGSAVGTEYTIKMDKSGGLQRGAAVRVADVRVGRVSAIDLEADSEWPVTLTLKIESSIALRDGATARVTTAGLFGDPFLALDPGPVEAPPHSGATLFGRAGPGMAEGLAKLDDLAGEAKLLLASTTELVDRVSTQVTPLIGRLDRLLSDDNLDALDGLLASLQGTMDETAPRIGELFDRLESLSATAEEALSDVPGMADDVQALTADLRKALGPDGERLGRVLDRAASTLDDASGSLAVLGDNRAEIEQSLADLRSSLRNLDELSQTLKEKPYSLIRIRPEADRKPGGR